MPVLTEEGGLCSAANHKAEEHRKLAMPQPLTLILMGTLTHKLQPAFALQAETSSPFPLTG